jgi:cell division protein FtsI/penicillin-binding protein 2
MPPRGTLLARDKTVLAAGASRTSTSPIATSIAGTVGPIPPERADRLRALGVPSEAEVGSTGLERVFDERLIGRPGGTLLAGSRTLAHAAPVQAEPVRTTISPKVQQAAVAALAGRYGGIATVDPRTGEVLAAAGVAWSALQPPGSTFKIVTLTGALEQGLAKPSTPFPVQTKATLEGVDLENANGESCGGTLAQSFAESCNSVFAPLGAKLGAKKLVDVAQRFGWNEDPGIAGASTPSIPPAARIGDDLAVGSSAIGQGRVQATALQMALVAATIGDRGRRPKPTLLFGERRAPVRATSTRVARTVERLMRGVVAFGTGTSAAIPGVVVAGKTGTAELESTVRPSGTPPPEEGPTPADKIPETDAWFAAVAPAAASSRPRAAVGVLLVRAGAGGDVAAPAARAVLQTALLR